MLLLFVEFFIDGLIIDDSKHSNSEETFLKASIAGVIIQKSGEIISFNQAFQDLIESVASIYVPCPASLEAALKGD